ncbi:hypothetical protein ACIPF8_18845 [Collimonas sp. NPDC087041]|uniref:hypothetical protein n=1 Tax=Collimonas sp. NPDC087041 TaxID=3363960 RepID=UPI00382B1BCF
MPAYKYNGYIYFPSAVFLEGEWHAMIRIAQPLPVDGEKIIEEEFPDLCDGFSTSKEAFAAAHTVAKQLIDRVAPGLNW